MIWTTTGTEYIHPNLEGAEVAITIKRKRLTNKDWSPNNEQECLLKRFFEEHPETRVAMISCPCKNCSFYF